jgi:hypothetical protein
MGIQFCKIGAVILATLGTVTAAQASTAWDESLNGDLSNDRLAPTAVTMTVGSNIVLGTTGNPGTGVDRDYFKITVPPGAVLSGITLLGNTTVSGGASFFAIEAGPQILCTPSGAGVENLLGFTHYGNGDVGSDILPNSLFLPAKPPLAAGTYSVWVQDTGGPATYGFDFVITSAGSASGDTDAPLPLWANLLLGAALLTAIWRAQSGALRTKA